MSREDFEGIAKHAKENHVARVAKNPSRADQGWCHCPICKKWVPEDLMNRDYDDVGKLLRMCTPCMDGTADQNDFVYDPDFGKVSCVYCRSNDTTEQASRCNWFKCNTCNKVFRRM